jgi:hypothetical protein
LFLKKHGGILEAYKKLIGENPAFIIAQIAQEALNGTNIFTPDTSNMNV